VSQLVERKDRKYQNVTHKKIINQYICRKTNTWPRKYKKETNITNNQRATWPPTCDVRCPGRVSIHRVTGTGLMVISINDVETTERDYESANGY